MEIYVTKKVESGEDFAMSTSKTLPYVHIIVSHVVIKRDVAGNYYLSEAKENTISNLIKIKRLIGKQQDLKNKPTDDVIWIKPSPRMTYSKDNLLIMYPKLILDYPVQVQLSCKSDDIITIDKPYNSYNIYWTVDNITVDDRFDINILA
jgi:hypothetical protein